MSEQSKIPARLREGIDAAKRGDKIAAKRLLQLVLNADVDNEMALMWMASVVDTLNERRFYLERALSINPNNNRAREALRRLGVADPQVRRAASTSTATATGETARRTVSGGTNLYLIAAAVVAFVIIAVIVASAVSSLQNQPTPAALQIAQATIAAPFAPPTATATIDRRPPSATLLPGIIVTLDTNLITPLPPTFTVTPSPLPTETPLPSATPFPLSSFTVLYADLEQGASQPSLYGGNADGSGEIKLQAGDGGGFRDVGYDPTGRRIVFVRSAADDIRNQSPELFVAPASSPEEAVQITAIPATTSFLANPSWSPDGKRLVFSSDQDGDPEIMLVNADGTGLVQLTHNTDVRDVEPRFSPDGTKITFTSDVNTPGFTEIYIMNADGSDLRQLTQIPNSYAAAWSPDGSRIAYVNDQQGDGDIYLIDADGQGSALLTQDDNGAEDNSPVWSPDGRWVVFASNRNDDQFGWYAIDLQGNVQPITLLGRNPQSLTFASR